MDLITGGNVPAIFARAKADHLSVGEQVFGGRRQLREHEGLVHSDSRRAIWTSPDRLGSIILREASMIPIRR